MKDNSANMLVAMDSYMDMSEQDVQTMSQSMKTTGLVQVKEQNYWDLNKGAAKQMAPIEEVMVLGEEEEPSSSLQPIMTFNELLGDDASNYGE